MRKANKLLLMFSVIAGVLLVWTTVRQVSAGAALVRHSATIEAAAPADRDAEGGPGLHAAPELRSTRLISIPYGFQSPLPIRDGGNAVWTGGHGGCTAGEEVTVAVTVTQPLSGALATGESVDTCTGQEQEWSSVATVETSDLLVPGTAEACGLATTRDGEGVTDTFEWCVNVELFIPDEDVFLPAVVVD